MKYTNKNGIVFLAILLVFSMSFIFAIKYENPSNIFDVKLSYINNVKLPYSIILNIENKVDSNLDYEIEIIYLKQNLVVGTEHLSCQNSCETKINIKKIFFDN